VTVHRVRLSDGSTQTIEAQRFRYVEHGIEFVGRKFRTKELVAFVPYVNLLLVVTELEGES
jgi:hypothetical protein